MNLDKFKEIIEKNKNLLRLEFEVHDEYGAWMIETIPKNPYTSYHK